MATNKNDNNAGSVILMVGIGFIIFIPFLIFTFMYYAKLKREFPLTESSQRIFDMGKLLPTFAIGGFASMVGYYALVVASSSKLAIILVPIFAITGIWLCYHIAKSIASTYFGVIVDPVRDSIILPKDMANYGIGDYLRLRFIKELGSLEIVKLSKVTKITRQAGKTLFVHGAFGSRGIEFTNKQKRDECLAAIENGCKTAITSVEFEAA